jgi:hypothetical protein
MANNVKITTVFSADIKDVKASIKEINSQMKAITKASTAHNKSNVKAQKDQLKNTRSTYKEQLKLLEAFDKKQQQITKKQSNHAVQQYKKELREKQRLDKSFGRSKGLFGTDVGRGVNRTDNSSFGRVNRVGGNVAGAVARSVAGIASGLAGFLMGAAMGGYQTLNEYRTALGPNIGLGKGSRVKAGISKSGGSRLGYSMIESAQLNPAMARATGALGPRELMQGVRSTGMESGQVAGIYGSLRSAGTSFAGGEFKGQSKGGREFAKIIAAGMESGLEKGRLPEFAEGVTTLLDQQAGRASGDVSATSVSSILAALGKTGLSGFQGSRGAAVTGKLEQAFLKPGGGEWGDNFIRMAMGFGKPGGKTGYYESEKSREKALSDPQNMSKLLGEVIRQFGSGKEGALGLRELTGVSLDQAEQLLKIEKDGGFTNDKLEEIKGVMDAAKPLEEQSLAAMKGIGEGIRHLAGRTDHLIGVGSKVQQEVELLEKWQFELLDALLEIKNTLKNLFEDIHEWLMIDSSKEAREKLTALDTKRRTDISLRGGKTQAEIEKDQAAMRMKELEAGMNLAKSTQKEDVGGTWKGVAKDVLADTFLPMLGNRLIHGGKNVSPADKAGISLGYTQNADAAATDLLFGMLGKKGIKRVPEELVPSYAKAVEATRLKRENKTAKPDPEYPSLDVEAANALRHDTRVFLKIDNNSDSRSKPPVARSQTKR